MIVQEITTHPTLQYKGKPIKRYLQRVDNNYFSNKPDEGQIVAQVHIKHYGVESDNTETYLGDSLAKDIITTMSADNKNYVDVNTNTRVPEGTPNSMPEYDYWILAVKNLPPGVTLFDLMKQQMLLFASRGDFDLYPL